jgi:DivIVA domain-containing protein
MSDTENGLHARRSAPRLTPERVRSVEFTRTPLGRRGWNEDEVQQFLQRVAEDIAARDAAEASLRAEVGFYKNRLRQWQNEQRGGQSEDPPGPAQPSVEAINILSQAQQEADAYVAQAQDYCRRLTADAQEHAQVILGDAQVQAEQAAEEAVRDYRARAGDQYTAEFEDLERRLAWARTFLSSLENVETQLRTAREALTYEVDKLAAGPSSGRMTGPGNAVPPPGRMTGPGDAVPAPGRVTGPGEAVPAPGRVAGPGDAGVAPPAV